MDEKSTILETLKKLLMGSSRVEPTMGEVKTQPEERFLNARPTLESGYGEDQGIYDAERAARRLLANKGINLGEPTQIDIENAKMYQDVGNASGGIKKINPALYKLGKELAISKGVNKMPVHELENRMLAESKAYPGLYNSPYNGKLMSTEEASSSFRNLNPYDKELLASVPEEQAYDAIYGKHFGYIPENDLAKKMTTTPEELSDASFNTTWNRKGDINYLKELLLKKRGMSGK